MLSTAHKWADGLHNPCHLRGPQCLTAGELYQKWPTGGQIGYITPAISGVPNASHRGTISTMAHKWADWLHNPCHLRGPQSFTVGDNIKNGPQVGGSAT